VRSVLPVSTPVIEAAVLVVGGAAATILLYSKRNDPAWRRLIPGLAATCAGILAFFASYFWLFEQGQCDGHGDMACMLNANQGALTFLGLAFAVVGLWVAAATRWADQRLAQAAEIAGTRHAMIAATDEVAHNLVHCGSCWHDDGWHGFMPQLTVSAIKLVLEPEHRKHIDPDVAEQADAISRNWEALKDIPPGWSVPPDSYTPQDPPSRMTEFISRSLAFIAYTLRFHPTWYSRRWLDQPRLKALHEVTNEEREVRTPFYTSELEDEHEDLRVNDMVIACWWDDAPVPEVKTYALGPLFKDVARGHRH
jgi:hypothetical protein